jgi:molybdopterin biosynthesis enzyme
LRRAGERLRATDRAALTAIGVDRVWTRAPRIGVVSTHPDVDESRNSVGALIGDIVQRAGSWVNSSLAPSGSNLERLLRNDRPDAFITIGGTGMGRRDATVATLARIGQVHIHGMGIRPGESAGVATIDARPVLMLPGRLDAALAAWLLVGRHFHARLTGGEEGTPSVKVTLARKIVSTIGLAEVIPVGYCQGGVEPLAAGYFPAHAVTRAAGWICVPPESEGFPQAATVDMRSWP